MDIVCALYRLLHPSIYTCTAEVQNWPPGLVAIIKPFHIPMYCMEYVGIERIFFKKISVKLCLKIFNKVHCIYVRRNACTLHLQIALLQAECIN